MKRKFSNIHIHIFISLSSVSFQQLKLEFKILIGIRFIPRPQRYLIIHYCNFVLNNYFIEVFLKGIVIVSDHV